ncbi:thymidylate kinase [Streptomyces niveiscabiei]|uniref:thymidylate kinase n=1 Tax=Streptomyces niveiscabiei TaxID=164115 RepID=UPI0029B24D99|nr:thymidylate kinase [Streptomyces niveiscabiei]MDX3381861.1 thymidylate kinase [Streptomyces niveiscabiei]
MLIALVGSDGAGKSTVTRLLTSAPGSAVPVRRSDRWDIVAEPQHYPSARLLRPDVQLGRTTAAEMPNPARFLFFLWSSCMALQGRDPAPAPATVTLLDGYWMKHAAVEVVHGLDRAWVESVGAGLPACDQVLYLRIAPETAWERKQGEEILPYECGGDPSCSRASFLAHQSRVQRVLDDWAARFGWRTVDADRPVEEIADIVREAAGLAGVPAGETR